MPKAQSAESGRRAAAATAVAAPAAKRRRVEAKALQTSFTTVVDIDGVVATFLPLKQQLDLRLVCGRWGTAVSDALRKLKCVKEITNAQLARLVKAFPELRSLDLSGCGKQLTIIGFRTLRGLAGLETLVLPALGSKWVTKGAQSTNTTDTVLKAAAQIATLTSLTVTGWSELTAVGLESLLQLPRLGALDISEGCHVPDAASFAVVARLPALKSLQLFGSNGPRSDEGVAEVCNALRLTSLDLRRCHNVTSAGAKHLVRLTALRTLRAPSDVSDALLAVAGRLPSLTSLDLARCARVTDSGFGQLSSLVRLAELTLAQCSSLTDASLAIVGRFEHLEKLDISDLPTLTDEGVKKLRGLTALKALRLDGDELISDESLAVLANLSLLETLQLQSANITDQGLQRIERLENLQTLDVSYCAQITSDGVVALAHMPKLATLRLNNCALIANNALKALRESKSLRALYLNFCTAITNDGLAFVGEIRTLHTLAVHGCASLSNPGLLHLYGLPSLRTVDIGACKRITANGANALRAAIPGVLVDL